MFRKCIFTISFVWLLLSLVVQTDSASGGDSHDWWTTRTVPTDFYNYQDDWHGSGNGDWFIAVNWFCQRSATARPPDPNTTAEIEPKADGPNITTPGATCARLDIQPWGWTGAVNIDCNIGPNAGFVDCGVVINVSGRTTMDSNLNGHGILNVYGGTMYTPAQYSGQGDTNGLYVGGGNTTTGLSWGIVNMYGGLISVPRVAVYNGTVNLYGGTLELTHDGSVLEPGRTTSNDFRMRDRYPRNMINITNGKLLLQGDRRVEIAPYIADGRIRAYNSRAHSSAVADYNAATDFNTVVTGVGDFWSAWNPSPAVGTDELDFITPPVLSWSPGDLVNTVPLATRTGWGQSAADTNGHRVYLGTTFDDVDNAVPGTVTATSVYRGTVDANDTNSYNILSRLPLYNGNGQLKFNTQYYWRIDEVNLGTVGSPWKGVIWNFMTTSGKPTLPYPPQGRDCNIGFDVNNKLFLRWTRGQYAATTSGHLIFFGTDYNSVRDANTSTPIIYRGVRTDANYPLSALSPNYTLVPEANYYWCVNEVNASNPLSPWRGNVWNFVFPSNYIVENYSEYVSSDDLNTVWKKGHLSGSCTGGGYVGGGATMSLDVATGSGENGAPCMQFDYNNTGALKDRYSEARFDYPTVGADWTVSSLSGTPTPKLLHIAYLGAGANAADPCLDRMYVLIRDNASHQGPTIYNPNPTAQMRSSSTWLDWYIPLSDLSTPSVDLTKVRYLFIGFGLRCNKQGTAGIPGGGSGTVRFDNIWVTQPVCNSVYGPAADFTGDCLVDTADVGLFVDNWLTSDTNLSYPDAVAPSVGPVLWYEFEQSGSDINAVNSGSAGRAYDGNVIKRNAFTWDANGRIGKCVNLAYGYNSYVNVPAAILAPFTDANGPNGITLTFWINTDINYPVPSEGPAVISAATSGSGTGDEAIGVSCPVSLTSPTIQAVIGLGPDVNAMTLSDFGGRWNHYAVVKDADTNTISIYHNGALLASKTRSELGKPLLSTVPLIFKIGERYGWDPSIVAKVDDFRMYDYALDANEIAWIATNGTKSLFVPLIQGNGTPNLKINSPSPQVVDFGDFAVLANQWLTEKLWP